MCFIQISLYPLSDVRNDLFSDLTYTTMDLTRLPVSLNKMKKSDMETIRQDREVWWNKFYAKVCHASLVVQTQVASLFSTRS